MRATVALSGNAASFGSVFNVGNSQEISINDLARQVKALTGSGSDIVHVSYDRAYSEGFEDLRRRVPDTSKLRRLIGFAPNRELDATLDRVIRYYRAQPPQSLDAILPDDGR